MTPFERFRRRILDALLAAEPCGMYVAILPSILAAGRRRPSASHVAGALAWLERAHLIERGFDSGSEPAFEFARLTNKGARQAFSHANPRRRRPSPTPAASSRPSLTQLADSPARHCCRNA